MGSALVHSSLQLSLENAFPAPRSRFDVPFSLERALRQDGRGEGLAPAAQARLPQSLSEGLQGPRRERRRRDFPSNPAPPPVSYLRRGNRLAPPSGVSRKALRSVRARSRPGARLGLGRRKTRGAAREPASCAGVINPTPIPRAGLRAASAVWPEPRGRGKWTLLNRAPAEDALVVACEGSPGPCILGL